MVETFGIRDIETIAKRLGTDIDTLKHKVHSLYTSPTIDDVTTIITYLANEEFENYIALCDDADILKIMSTQYVPILDYEDNGTPTNEYTIIIERIKELEKINNKKIEYDLYNAPKNNYTCVDERIKELNLKNHNKDTHTSNTNQNTNITIYVPTAEQAREQSRSCRQLQINTIINIIKPVVEKEIIEAINKGLYKVDITRFFNDEVFNDNEVLKIKNAICDINNTEYTYEDFTQAMDTIRWLLIDKGYDVKIYYNKYENGIEVNWKK